ncbi:MAG: ATP-binding cassette domain-containing protein [Owenweeksia sp.]|nr:ATP-binding cassette domain-containing protein [Owenweeksia sp.]
MEVRLENLSRSFGRQQVLKNISTRIKSGECHAILGGNGSGKSTLLKLIQGSLTPTSGKIFYQLGSREIPREKAAYKINLTGPYLELIEELTARDFLDFFQNFVP